MKEDCASSMSAQHGCNDDKAVVESFKEALKQRIGVDHFRMWFSQGVTFTLDRKSLDVPSAASNENRLILNVRGQFALDRLRKNFMREMRAAAMQASGERACIQLELESSEAIQAQLPLDQHPIHADGVQRESRQRSAQGVGRPTTGKRRSRGGTKSMSALTVGTAVALRNAKSDQHRPARNRAAVQAETQLGLPNLDSDQPTGQIADRQAAQSITSESNELTDARPAAMTAASFVPGSCNQLAHTAMVMACQSPGTASPLFLCGPSGTGKTHLLSAIADQLRRRHRMRRVIHLSAEQFTNDFITSVGNSGISSFRRRYREVDALLVDDVQFLGAKRATLREMLYTVETLAGAGRPLIFSGNQSPTEIPGLTRELAGRMAAGLLCPMQPLDQATRETLLRRALQERCTIEVPDEIVAIINPLLLGDGRVVSGVANLINTLQRMFRRMPTMDEIRQFGGDLLRAAKPIATLSAIENAVCQTFHLPDASLRAASQTRAVSEPRMLAMHLSRQLTSAAYAEIGGHFGGRTHSTAIAAGHNVQTWLKNGKSIGRGSSAITAQEAIDRIEALLRSG